MMYVRSSRTIPVAEKYQLITAHFKPGANYILPKNASGRTFQYRWLQRYHWLAYSKKENGGFCIPCILFAPSGHHGSDPGVLVQRPLTSFYKALEMLAKHTEKAYHKAAIVRVDEYCHVMRNQNSDIRCQKNHAMAERIASNRKKLASIVETIMLCGLQNIPLRGHGDNLTDIERDVSENHGNFWALLKFRVEAGDKILE